jgi:hypothetical protein
MSTGWQKQEESAFDREKTNDTPESAPIRNRDQVLSLLEQVIRDRAFARRTVVLEDPDVQTHTKVLDVLFVYCQSGIRN